MLKKIALPMSLFFGAYSSATSYKNENKQQLIKKVKQLKSHLANSDNQRFLFTELCTAALSYLNATLYSQNIAESLREGIGWFLFINMATVVVMSMHAFIDPNINTLPDFTLKLAIGNGVLFAAYLTPLTISEMTQEL